MTNQGEYQSKLRLWLAVGREMGLPIEQLLHKQQLDTLILSYGDPFKEMISQVNERFQETSAEIPEGQGEVKIGNIIVSSAVRQIAYERGFPHSPITPQQSEELLRQYQEDPNSVQKPLDQYREETSLILYDYSENGRNPEHAKNLVSKLSDLGMTENNLPLLLYNLGLQPNSDLPHGIEFTIIPELTKAYQHPILEKTGESHSFTYGSEEGLPSKEDLTEGGNRILRMPSETQDIGLRVLFRYRDFNLYARVKELDSPTIIGRVTLT